MQAIIRVHGSVSEPLILDSSPRLLLHDDASDVRSLGLHRLPFQLLFLNVSELRYVMLKLQILEVTSQSVHLPWD